ncbi:MAG: BMP family ABC transporter substrate-binding protein [Azospirillaceae bacterium]|nr:BMP family ABC transporter substrate-binding protein [Azospirillaceae bacterium]
MDRRQFLVSTAAGAVTLAAGTAAVSAADKLKAGFIYVGPVGDFGYSYQHDLGRKAVEKALGDRVETSFAENVSEGADAERVINQFASTGYGIVFATSFGFMNAAVKVAARYPKIKFEHATGYKRGPNLATYSARFYEGRTVVGRIVAHMTKNGKIGYIGSFPIPEVVNGINAFTIALRRIRPDAEVHVIWAGSWYDPGKESAAAKALIDQGCDVICQHTDSPAAVQAAQERGIWAVGQSSDMTSFGPKAHLTAIVENWTGYYVDRVKAVLDDSWKPIDTWGGLSSGMVQLAPLNPAIPADVQDLAKQTIADISSGALHPFAGPIKDQTGKLVVAEGQHASDPDILSMAYFVEGVQGTLPT